MLPGGWIAFASEIKAILAHGGLAARPNARQVAEFSLGAQNPLSDDTFFQHVRRLMPATALRVDAGGAIEKRWRFWTPDYTHTMQARDEAAKVAAFRNLLGESVLQRLETSDVRVGACLSGGLDSSIMVGLLAGTDQARAGSFRHTISARFDDDPTMSEGDYIDAVLAHTGLEGSSVTPTADTLVSESQRLHWHQEEPFLSASIYLEWCVMRRARELGCKVMIDGQGSDELLGGYQPYFPIFQRDLVRRREYLELARNTRRFNGRMAAEAEKYIDSRRRFNHCVGLSWRELLEYAWKGADERLPEAAGVPDGSGGRAFRHQLAYGMLHSLIPVQLHSADRSAMAFGVETRFPFLDHRLVDWSITLPDKLLVHDGWQKYILRKAAAGLIPERVRWRVDKVGFAAPQDRWLRSAIRPWVEERLFSGPIRELDTYDRRALEQAWQAHVSGRADHSSFLWRWISLNEWLLLFDAAGWGSKMKTPSVPQTTQLPS
jgi:asparagine synthase (glutamine-hydrolysing)